MDHTHNSNIYLYSLVCMCICLWLVMKQFNDKYVYLIPYNSYLLFISTTLSDYSEKIVNTFEAYWSTFL